MQGELFAQVAAELHLRSDDVLARWFKDEGVASCGTERRLVFTFNSDKELADLTDESGPCPAGDARPRLRGDIRLQVVQPLHSSSEGDAFPSVRPDLNVTTVLLKVSGKDNEGLVMEAFPAESDDDSDDSRYEAEVSETAVAEQDTSSLLACRV